ncbi:MAG: hypothetical protein ACREA9_24685 [Pyrinomonadaceae bacterium]
MAIAFAAARSIPARGGAFGGGLKFKIGRLTCDTDYPDGGWALSAALFGFPSAVVAVIPMGGAHASPTTGAEVVYGVSYDSVDGKLQAYASAADGDAFDEIATGADGISGLVVDVLAIGY